MRRDLGSCRGKIVSLLSLSLWIFFSFRGYARLRATETERLLNTRITSRLRLATDEMVLERKNASQSGSGNYAQ